MTVATLAQDSIRIEVALGWRSFAAAVAAVLVVAAIQLFLHRRTKKANAGGRPAELIDIYRYAIRRDGAQPAPGSYDTALWETMHAAAVQATPPGQEWTEETIQARTWAAHVLLTDPELGRP